MARKKFEFDGMPNTLKNMSKDEITKNGYLLFHMAGLVMDVAEKYHVSTDEVIKFITEWIMEDERKERENAKRTD